MKQPTHRPTDFDHALGVEREISRPDFINGATMVAGSFATAHHLRDTRKGDLGGAGHAAEIHDLAVVGASPHADATFPTAHWAVEQVLEKLAYPFVSHNTKGGGI